MSYTVQETVDEIRFETSTTQDLSKKSINDIFNDKQIVRQLKKILDLYASKTLAIEGIYSTPISVTTRQIDEPTDILRTEAYQFGWVWISGRKYPFDVKPLKIVHSLFPYDTFVGVPSWLVAWEKQLDIYPLSSNSFSSTTLTSNITDSDTTIPVVSTSGFNSPTNGRITIGDEKIKYKRFDDTNFYTCTRGVENTTAISHNDNEEVKENNFFLYYYKKHFEIELFDDNQIKNSFLNKEMEISDEHMPAIINGASSLLLTKIDIERAQKYKTEWQIWLIEAQKEIRYGRSSISKGGNIRDPFSWELDAPYDWIRE